MLFRLGGHLVVVVSNSCCSLIIDNTVQIFFLYKYYSWNFAVFEFDQGQWLTSICWCFLTLIHLFIFFFFIFSLFSLSSQHCLVSVFSCHRYERCLQIEFLFLVRERESKIIYFFSWFFWYFAMFKIYKIKLLWHQTLLYLEKDEIFKV